MQGCMGSMRGDQKRQHKLAQAKHEDSWGGWVLDVYSDGGADLGVGRTLEASAECGWLVGGTDEDSLEIWAEGVHVAY